MARDYFDFGHVTEEDEGLDYKRLVPCPHCKKPIPHNATMCLYCGEDVFHHSHKKTWVFWVALFLLIMFVALVLLY
jgi:predicted nucleic acid-binding Zn ribbon protein